MAPAKPVAAADDQLASFLFLPEGQKPASRGGSLKFSDGSSKLLSGHKFQDKHVSLSAGRLLLYRDVKVSKLLFSAKSTAAASCKHSATAEDFLLLLLLLSPSFPCFLFSLHANGV